MENTRHPHSSASTISSRRSRSRVVQYTRHPRHWHWHWQSHPSIHPFIHSSIHPSIHTKQVQPGQSNQSNPTNKISHAIPRHWSKCKKAIFAPPCPCRHTIVVVLTPAARCSTTANPQSLTSLQHPALSPAVSFSLLLSRGQLRLIVLGKPASTPSYSCTCINLLQHGRLGRCATEAQ